ncbi:putative atp-dependent rna helicase dob1 protein [Phaeoacremonium minimum UCRPA7]|uniref:Putative atp-dependent rna helicase dob1 protein n=1 Tax=Phaeoacremonium minimum (strain UCR-PA7) TaxID=1286976 RepID=R8BW95_PHAM7|nr:putative atp-dependent rna helicase dob1 protein [Phaeoacremonium minimum UCRPA7]EOO03579.1 putative atp-dependent rna helicase dob1 protein [Phaeoacremonium minimum UCRPA7]
MDGDLFDVFDEQPQKAGATEAPATKSITKREKKDKSDKSKKRKADGHMKNGQSGNEEADVDMADGEPTSLDGETHDDDSDGAQDNKRRKKEDEAEPVLTDTFETAASREVAAAAGFAAAQGNESLVLSHNIQHQVALPPDLDYEYVPLSEHKAPEEPARVYPFKLDPFQALSVASIERDESVLVSAHTSAGKTVVAEYAIAQCLKRNQRVIYTSPIKALSNQKYRDFQADFGDVGLMTGDVTINPTASCLVMTTEILRSMLYRGSEIMREVAWVVFDEIHYLRDKSRGVVWEETIILLPDKVRYVFLSATIPNAFQFAEWIAKIHRQACHVVYTDFRPTPLQNYFFPAGGEGIFLIVDEKGVFKEKNFNTAMALIEQKKGADPSDPMARQKGKGKNKKTNKGGSSDSGSDIYKIIKMIMKRSFHPVIVFNFSKRDCEMMALKISQMTFNNDSEKQLVREVFSSAINQLSEEDRDLPQIQHILPLLERGIGVHHSGLLPILKETIEILFQEGLIKVLFATETFSIGLNMPARTVVFTQVTKWDGVQRRPLTTGEYIQMSGRAGRRGLDDRGIVIMMVDDKLEPETAKSIVAGAQDKLNSAFYLGYNMVLNLQRIETISPEFMLERCFYQFQNAASVPELEKELIALQQERDNMVIADESTVKEYYGLRQQLESYTKDMVSVIQHPNYCLEFLQPGRLVHIKTPTGEDYDWGVILNFTPRRSPKAGEPEYPPQEQYFVDVLLRLDGDSDDVVRVHPPGVMPQGIRPYLKSSSDHGRYQVVPCLLNCVVAFSQIRVFMKGDLKTSQEMAQCGKHLEEVHRRFPDGIPILDPIENMDIRDDSFKQLMRKIEVLESRLLSNPLHGSPLLQELWEQYATKVKLNEKIKEKKKAIAKAHSIAQLDELKSRKRVLRRLGFINEAEVVQMKARVACEISSTEGHELLLSELLFNRFFNELTPELCASVLSVFIFDEKVETQDLKEELAKPFREIQQQARVIAKVSQESKLDVNEDEYVQSLKWQLMETVYQWAQGRPFAEICKMTNAYEGSLIRLFRRLEELLRQMAQAGKVMGSEELTKKFETSLQKIKRDIVAAQSLYL